MALSDLTYAEILRRASDDVRRLRSFTPEFASLPLLSGHLASPSYAETNDRLRSAAQAVSRLSTKLSREVHRLQTNPVSAAAQDIRRQANSIAGPFRALTNRWLEDLDPDRHLHELDRTVDTAMHGSLLIARVKEYSSYWEGRAAMLLGEIAAVECTLEHRYGRPMPRLPEIGAPPAIGSFPSIGKHLSYESERGRRLSGWWIFAKYEYKSVFNIRDKWFDRAAEFLLTACEGSSVFIDAWDSRLVHHWFVEVVDPSIAEPAREYLTIDIVRRRLSMSKRVLSRLDSLASEAGVDA